ncbi:NAD(P)/FAD-dependent oxidoreductase [Streptomyces buecherae]|nr:FAD-dependent oxidoreductase [Streptomyces buecherae]
MKTAMKTLLTVVNPDLARTDFLRSGDVVHVPEAADADERRLLNALCRHGATALVATQRPSDTLLRAWARHAAGPVQVAYAVPATGRSSGPCAPADAGHTVPPPRSGGRHQPAPTVYEHPLGGTDVESIATALAHCERAVARARAVPAGLAPAAGGPREAFLIGAGLVNLVTAVYLADAGYRLTVVDGSPAPGTAQWGAYGCTHGGDDARMFTFTEMDGYNNTDFHGGVPTWFRRPVTDCGWLAREPWSLTPQEHAWIQAFESVPSWLARAYTADVFALSVEAGREWSALRARLPHLFEDVVLTDGILRVYTDPDHLRAATARHRSIGALLGGVAPADIARDHPALARAAGAGALAGGVLVPGFTLNVHRFTERLVAHLVDRGARFHWRTPVTGVRRDAHGALVGFDCAVPVPEHAHVIASPGVAGAALLRGTPCEGRVHGVLGGWMRVDNRDPALRTSLKVARRGHVTEDANITVARDGDGRSVLIVGSGYGYIGTSDSPDERQLAAIRAGIANTIGQLFPGSAAPAPSSRTHDNYAFKYCVRPWTATSLGLYHVEPRQPRRTAPHQGGLFIVTGGHNTGGFAQSPAIGRAVLASVCGASHPMHTLYHPERHPAPAARFAPLSLSSPA